MDTDNTHCCKINNHRMGILGCSFLYQTWAKGAYFLHDGLNLWLAKIVDRVMCVPASSCMTLSCVWPKKKKVWWNSNVHLWTGWVSHVHTTTGGLFIAEHIGVKVVDCIRCDEGADEGKGPDNQNRHIVWSTGRKSRVPVWGPVGAWKQKKLIYIYICYI